MKLLVLCVTLCVGTAVSAPADPAEAETSPVASPASPAEEKPAEPRPEEEKPAEEGTETRPKRWYYHPSLPYDPYYGPGYGYATGGFAVDLAPAGSFAAPVAAVAAPAVSGRTRFSPEPQFRTTASLNELLDHNRRQEHLWQHQQWQRDQHFRNNYPDVIDTAAYAPQPNNFPNRPLNNGNRSPEVIDTQSPEFRTRGSPDLLHSPSGPVPSFAFEPGFNPNFHPYPQPYPYPAFP